MDIKALQRPLRKRYEADPDSAPLTLTVRSAPSDLADPLHCAVAPDSIRASHGGRGLIVPWVALATSRARPTFCSAPLPRVRRSRLRMVAANLGIELTDVEVVVEGDWDPRGTLAMGRDYPVGLTAIRCRTKVKLAGDVDEDRAARLLRSAERYCVVLNTLQGGVDVGSTFEIEAPEPKA